MGRGQPPACDVAEIIEHIRTGASAEYPVEALPNGLQSWRRRLRAEASRVGRRVSVRALGPGMVIVFDPDYEPCADELRAVADVILADITGHRLSYDDAVRARRRARLRLVRDDA